MINIVLLCVSYHLLKQSGIDLKDVADTSDYILLLELTDEPSCRSKDPIVLVQDLDMNSLEKVFIGNIIACVVTLAFLYFSCFSCEPIIQERMR